MIEVNFEKGKNYTNNIGEYEVLEINFSKLKVRYLNTGEIKNLDRELQSRIVTRLTTPPPEPKPVKVVKRKTTKTAVKNVAKPQLFDTFDPNALATLIQYFKNSPLHGTFDSASHREIERDYKRKASIDMQASLTKEVLGELKAAKKFDEAKKLITKLCTKSKDNPDLNLINQYDMRAIREADEELLTTRLYNLLYGEASFDSRFNAWIEVFNIRDEKCWAPATYFLMLSNPKEHFFVRPEPMQKFLGELRSSIVWQPKTTVALYLDLQRLAKALLTELKSLGAEDLIDVQSFMWVLFGKNGICVPTKKSSKISG